MSKRDPNFMLTFVPCESPQCRVCIDEDPAHRAGSARLDDVAMDLARRGAGYHEIVHVMLTWASLAADRAIVWAQREDARERQDNAEAMWDDIHGSNYEDPPT